MIMCKLFNLNKRFFILFVLIQIFFCFSVSAEYLSSEEFGYTIDLPDGFYVAESNSTGYFLESEFIPIEIIINVYESSRFSSSKECLEFCSDKLHGNIEIENFTWRNRQTSLGSMSFYFNNILCDAWALAVQLPDKNKIFSLIAYTAHESEEIFKQMILSILDSVCIDRGSFFEAGAITTFAFPQGEKGSIVPLDASGWAIAKSSKNKIMARKLVDFLASKENSQKFAQSGLIVPARKDVAESIYFLDNKKPRNAKAFLTAIESSKPTPVSIDYKEILDNLKGRFEKDFN